MPWINPTAILTAWRAVLMLSPTIIAAGNQAAQFNYPNVDLSPGANNGAGPIWPAYLLAEIVGKRARIADGARGLRAGQLVFTAYLPLSTFPTAADCETFIRAVDTDIWDPTLTNVTNVPAFVDTSTGLASDPTSAQRAAGDDIVGSPSTTFRTITLTADCGLSR